MGSTIYERLGPKPAKYSMGQALGDAIKGGGAYFGAVAVEKAKAEALQQARAAKLEDRDYDAKVAASTVEAEEAKYQRRLVDQRATAVLNTDNSADLHARNSVSDLAALPTQIAIENEGAINLSNDQWDADVRNGKFEGLNAADLRAIKQYRDKSDIDGKATVKEYEDKRKSDLDAGVTRTLADQDARDDMLESRANIYKATKISREIPVLGSDLTSRFKLEDTTIVADTHYIALTNDSGEVINYIKDPEWTIGPNGISTKIGSGDGTGGEKPSVIRKEFTSATNTFVLVDEAYGRISASAEEPSAAGDLSMIFNYMKMLDPGSVVRESEFATARGAASVPERFKAMYERALSGEMLSPATRDDFLSRADGLYTQALSGYDNVTNEFTRMATESNISPTLVVFDRANMRGSGDDAKLLERIRQRNANRKKGGS